MATKKDPRITILKGLCMIMVVVDHSGCPKPLFLFDLSMLMPIFLMASGYFFKPSWFARPGEYARGKFKSLYLPYVKWSLIFLLLHNVFFYLGILNASYGNDDGVCSNAYSLAEAGRRAADIFLRMNGHEGFLLGAFWFLRTLLVTLLVVCLGGSLLHRKVKSESACIAILAVLAAAGGFVIAFLQRGIPYFPQGGYREAMGVFFIGCGYFFHKLDRYWQNNLAAAVALVIQVAVVSVQWTGLLPDATVAQWAAVMATGTCGFIVMHRVSSLINLAPEKIRKAIIYAGENTFYILTFHLLMLKPVSLLKAWFYGLDWHAVGCHPYVHLVQDNWFWLLYVCTAVPLSLLVGHYVKKVKWLRI